MTALSGESLASARSFSIPVGPTSLIEPTEVPSATRFAVGQAGSDGAAATGVAGSKDAEKITCATP
jgi:hypothetical protein